VAFFSKKKQKQNTGEKKKFIAVLASNHLKIVREPEQWGDKASTSP